MMTEFTFFGWTVPLRSVVVCQRLCKVVLGDFWSVAKVLWVVVRATAKAKGMF